VSQGNVELVHKLLAAGARVNEYYPVDTDPDDVWVANALPLAAAWRHSDIV
jgi:hypothetical protein